MRIAIAVAACAWLCASAAPQVQRSSPRVGDERAVPTHLKDGDERRLSAEALVDAGRKLFAANWTEEDGGGRPRLKGTGAPLSDPSRPLSGDRAFNRVSGPEANSCQGCHNLPHGITGGGGDVVTVLFDGAEVFDFATFDRHDARPGAGSLNTRGEPVTLASLGVRATPGLFGAGYVEMLARQMTADLQRLRDALAPGQQVKLVAKGVSFGTLTRDAGGRWDVSGVRGLSRASVTTSAGKPTLIVRPWTQSGRSVSLRELTVELLNRTHGIQATERFGHGTDPDGDGVTDEATPADVTALVAFQAALPVPGRVIPRDAEVERAIRDGEAAFTEIGCSDCHRSLTLDRGGWLYSEPNPYNPAGLWRAAAGRRLEIDLSDPKLPSPRLAVPASGGFDVPLYSDLKLHDLGDPGGAFLTRRLWGAANEPPYWHDGTLTTMRAAILQHHGEGEQARSAFAALPAGRQDALVEFLKSLQVLPQGTTARVVDERFRPRD
jgi:hypothetical protein